VIAEASSAPEQGDMIEIDDARAMKSDDA